MIIHRIRHWATRQPDRPAIIHNDRPIGYGEFWGALLLARQLLARERIAPARTAVVMIEDLVQAWLAVLALRWLGIDTVCVTAFETALQLDLADIACVVVAQDESPSLPSLRDLNLKTVKLPAIGPEQLERPLSPQRRAPRRYGGHLLYTSGTTGTYKKLKFAAVGEDARNEARALAMGFSASSVFHGVNFGLWTGAGYKQPMAIWHRGACVVFDQRADALARLFSHPITKASLLPPMIRELLQSTPSIGNEPVRPDLELNSMSGFLSLPLAEELTRRISPRLCITYSATELVGVPMQAMFRSQEDLDWLSVSPGWTVEVIDERGLACDDDVEGEIRIRLSAVDCRGYLDDPEATARCFRDGWFHPGDRGVRRSDGRIRLLGRIADVINLHGAKVAAAPLEQRLQRRLGVEDVCLFSHLNAAGREELLVALQSPRSLDSDKEAWLRGEFDDFDSVRIGVLPAFPRTGTGTRKVLRGALKERLLKEPPP